MTASKGKKKQVLLVEDNLTDAILIRTLLEQDENLRVTLAQDGIRGCQLAEHQRWDLVVTDINLPGRDGIEVIQTSKTHQPQTPVLATSAYSAPAYMEGAYRSGANEVLAKPVDGSELMVIVRDLLAVKELADAKPRRILAIGALPGDVEAGCGGVLLKHVQDGDQINIMILSSGMDGHEGRGGAARRACQAIGGRLLMPDEDGGRLGDLDYMIIRIQDAVHELEPEIIFAPSANDVRESRQNAFQATEIAGSKVPGFYCYQAATTTLDFRPTVFEDISDYLAQKMVALEHYEAQVKGRPHLDPELARATARYWGRFLGYGEVEPFEVVRATI